LAFKPDGSFSTEAVPPGNYTVSVTVYEQGPDRVLGTANHPIVVPAVPAASGYSADPFDVGVVPIQFMPRLDAGQLAPDFEATTLDGKTIRLSQFRGKYVLIIFWSKSSRADVTLADSRNLSALHKTFGKLGRFVMLGINTDMEPDRLKNLLNQRGWYWLNASVRWDVWDKLLDDYSLPKSGSIWMIGSDGKVLARDLRGDSIKQVGTILLRAK
jgi:peroxiredoxin